jgi:hypothetical protein
MTATNTGQATLRGYKIAVWLPPGLEFVQAGGNGSIVYNPGQRLVSAVPVPLPPGETAALSFETVVESGVEEYLLLTLSGSAPHLQRTAQAQLELHVVQNPGAGSGEDGLSDKLSLGLEPESGDSVGDGFDPAFKGGWSPQFNEPVVSTFSGAATYQYPIELPPGRNGLQPTLGLSYNSKRVDGLLQWQSSEWVGLGWNIETIDIVRTGIGEMWPGNPDFWLKYDNVFRLIMNGASYDLQPASGSEDQLYGRYYADDMPGLYVERINSCSNGNCNDLLGGSPANVTTEYWIVKTSDGTTYRLGYQADAEQVIFRTANDGGQSYPYSGPVWAHTAYRWRVDLVTDIHGNTTIYQYKECRTGGTNCAVFPSGPSEQREIASYPNKISYNQVGSSWLAEVEFISTCKKESRRL